MINQILINATKFADLGISVIPILYRDKRPDSSLLPRDTNGQASWEPFKTQLPTLETLRAWFASGQINYGIISGWRDLVVIDFDDAQEYTRWLFWARNNPVSANVANHAYRVRTARGVHVYVRIPHIERTRKIGKIDIKAAGGYVLGPGSTHPSGALYTALTSSFHFPVVSALGDILPASLLLSDATVTTPIPPQSANADIWQRVDHPFTYTEKLIDKLRRDYRVESFFPNAKSSSADGRWFLDVCPFHDDKNPSFWIDTQRQICGCFSGCTPKPLDSINLFAQLYGLTNRDAIRAMTQSY